MERERDEPIPSPGDAVPDDVGLTDDKDVQPPDVDEDHVVEETGAEPDG